MESIKDGQQKDDDLTQRKVFKVAQTLPTQ